MSDVISLAVEKKGRITEVLARNPTARAYRNWLVKRTIRQATPQDFDRLKAFECALVESVPRISRLRPATPREQARVALRAALEAYPMPSDGRA